jgi:zinc protease
MTAHSRLSIGRRGAWLTAFLVVAQISLAGQDPKPLPPASEIIAKYVKAIGGEAALKNVKSIHAQGTFLMPANGATGVFNAKSARPSKLLQTVDVTAIGHIETGYDGKLGWIIDPLSGPMVAKERQLSELADDAYFDSPLHGADFVKSATTVGREAFDKRQALKVKVVFVSGNEQDEYFDVETGLLIGYEAMRVTSLGIMPTVNVLRDYKKFGALMHATTMVMRTIGIEQMVTITAVEYNNVPASAFDAPPQIKAMIK